MPADDPQPTRSPKWRRTILLGLLAAAGLFAIPRWMPASSIGSVDAGPLSGQPTAEARAGNPEGGQALRQAPESPAADAPRAWPRCPECGVIESVRELADSGGASALQPVADHARRPGATDDATAAKDDRRYGYEVTVRFRDGSTTTFDASGPRLWRVGSRVNVLGAP